MTDVMMTMTMMMTMMTMTTTMMMMMMMMMMMTTMMTMMMMIMTKWILSALHKKAVLCAHFISLLIMDAFIILFHECA